MNDPEDPAEAAALAAILSRGSALAVLVDGDGRVVQASPELLRRAGREGGLAPGRPFAEALSDTTRPRYEQQILQKVFATGAATGGVADVDLEIRVSRSEVMAVRASAVALGGQGGPQALLLLTDLSDLHASLQARDLRAAEAAEASEAKTRFLAALSHEIRTPMNAILGFAQLLDLSELDDTRRGHVRSILSAGQSLMALLADLLDMSQVEAGRMRIDLRPFDLPEMLEEVAGWWRNPAADKGVAMILSIAPEVPHRIRSDRGRIEQVLHNYLGNAVKFTEAGEIRLRVEPVDLPSGGAGLRFRVADTGPGIAAADIARLYQPFEQIEGEGAAARAGWGLGLSICAAIAEAMGADVGVESGAGQGAAFWFDIPLEPATDGDSEPPPEPPPEVEGDPALPEGAASDEPSAASEGVRVLLAEDDRLNQEVLRRILEGLGHRVTVVGDGFDALERLATTEVDLVIMDVMMPGLDGAAATARLRKAGHARRHVPVIGCSAHVTAEAEARYREAGMSAFLPKPVDRARLVAAIAEALADPRGE